MFNFRVGAANEARKLIKLTNTALLEACYAQTNPYFWDENVSSDFHAVLMQFYELENYLKIFPQYQKLLEDFVKTKAYTLSPWVDKLNNQAVNPLSEIIPILKQYAALQSMMSDLARDQRAQAEPFWEARLKGKNIRSAADMMPIFKEHAAYKAMISKFKLNIAESKHQKHSIKYWDERLSTVRDQFSVSEMEPILKEFNAMKEMLGRFKDNFKHLHTPWKKKIAEQKLDVDSLSDMVPILKEYAASINESLDAIPLAVDISLEETLKPKMASIVILPEEKSSEMLSAGETEELLSDAMLTARGKYAFLMNFKMMRLEKEDSLEMMVKKFWELRRRLHMIRLLPADEPIRTIMESYYKAYAAIGFSNVEVLNEYPRGFVLAREGALHRKINHFIQLLQQLSDLQSIQKALVAISTVQTWGIPRELDSILKLIAEFNNENIRFIIDFIFKSTGPETQQQLRDAAEWLGYSLVTTTANDVDALTAIIRDQMQNVHKGVRQAFVEADQRQGWMKQHELEVSFQETQDFDARYTSLTEQRKNHQKLWGEVEQPQPKPVAESKMSAVPEKAESKANPGTALVLRLGGKKEDIGKAKKFKHFKIDESKPISLGDVKKQWREFALTAHPDKAGQDAETVQKFKEINAEYELLQAMLKAQVPDESKIQAFVKESLQSTKAINEIAFRAKIKNYLHDLCVDVTTVNPIPAVLKMMRALDRAYVQTKAEVKVANINKKRVQVLKEIYVEYLQELVECVTFPKGYIWEDMLAIYQLAPSDAEFARSSPLLTAETGSSLFARFSSKKSPLESMEALLTESVAEMQKKAAAKAKTEREHQDKLRSVKERMMPLFVTDGRVYRSTADLRAIVEAVFDFSVDEYYWGNPARKEEGERARIEKLNKEHLDVAVGWAISSVLEQTKLGDKYDDVLQKQGLTQKQLDKMVLAFAKSSKSLKPKPEVGIDHAAYRARYDDMKASPPAHTHAPGTQASPFLEIKEAKQSAGMSIGERQQLIRNYLEQLLQKNQRTGVYSGVTWTFLMQLTATRDSGGVSSDLGTRLYDLINKVVQNLDSDLYQSVIHAAGLMPHQYKDNMGPQGQNGILNEVSPSQFDRIVECLAESPNALKDAVAKPEAVEVKQTQAWSEQEMMERQRIFATFLSREFKSMPGSSRFNCERDLQQLIRHATMEKSLGLDFYPALLGIISSAGLEMRQYMVQEAPLTSRYCPLHDLTEQQLNDLVDSLVKSSLPYSLAAQMLDRETQDLEASLRPSKSKGVGVLKPLRPRRGAVADGADGKSQAADTHAKLHVALSLSGDQGSTANPASPPVQQSAAQADRTAPNQDEQPAQAAQQQPQGRTDQTAPLSPPRKKS